ncbi:methyltransferase [Planosporangium thailandense]|uniref:Methyltransferase n=1 Tax=Planosporangium thailandense TaxID=765197 RepID=A0ABX0Y0W0_9ACTN|nr:methyltransferase [Planosporangium thailandense]
MHPPTGPVPTSDFVRSHTRLGAPSAVPEVLLHLADEPIDLWERTEQARGHELPPPFWAFAWAGGQALARHLLDHPDLVRDRVVFDLAAGSGLVAIAAARAGASHVTAVEIDPLAGSAITVNATANGVDVAVVLGDVLDGDAGGAEVVLAGDVFYSRPMTERVLPFLQRARATGARVLVGDPGRAYLPRGLFTAVATYDIPVTQALESAESKLTTVWELP